MEARCEWVRAVERDNEQSQKDRGKTKSLKTAPIFPKHAFFVTEMSRQKIARSSCQNTQGQNLKIFLSVFRNWKVYQRVSRELSHENL